MPPRSAPRAAAAAMRERGYMPQEPYPGGKPVRCIHEACGREVSPTYSRVVNAASAAASHARMPPSASTSCRCRRHARARLQPAGALPGSNNKPCVAHAAPARPPGLKSLPGHDSTHPATVVRVVVVVPRNASVPIPLEPYPRRARRASRRGERFPELTRRAHSREGPGPRPGSHDGTAGPAGLAFRLFPAPSGGSTRPAPRVHVCGRVSRRYDCRENVCKFCSSTRHSQAYQSLTQ